MAAIREHLAREAREARPDEVEKLVRGRVVGTSPDELRYEYFDVGEPDSSYDDLEKRGFQGGGERWAGIVEGLIALERPTLRTSLRFDPEGDILILSATVMEGASFPLAVHPGHRRQSPSPRDRRFVRPIRG